MSLFVDPRFVERLLASAPHSADAGGERVLALFGRYLAAVRYFGAAVEWRDGFVLHTEEVVDPSRLSPALSRWAGQTAAPAAFLHRIPPTALAMATAHVDFGILLDGFDALIPKADHPKLDNLVLALDGLLLGLDLRSALLPHLGPGALAYIERPDADQGAGKMPVVVSVEIDRGPAGVKAAAALDNALRTLLAVYALDDKHGGGRLRVESKTVGEAKITALNASTPLAYAVIDGRLILGTTAGAVARALAAQADPRRATASRGSATRSSLARPASPSPTCAHPRFRRPPPPGPRSSHGRADRTAPCPTPARPRPGPRPYRPLRRLVPHQRRRPRFLASSPHARPGEDAGVATLSRHLLFRHRRPPCQMRRARRRPERANQPAVATQSRTADAGSGTTVTESIVPE